MSKAAQGSNLTATHPAPVITPGPSRPAAQKLYQKEEGQSFLRPGQSGDMSSTPHSGYATAAGGAYGGHEMADMNGYYHNAPALPVGAQGYQSYSYDSPVEPVQQPSIDHLSNPAAGSSAYQHSSAASSNYQPAFGLQTDPSRQGGSSSLPHSSSYVPYSPAQSPFPNQQHDHSTYSQSTYPHASYAAPGGYQADQYEPSQGAASYGEQYSTGFAAEHPPAYPEDAPQHTHNMSKRHPGP